MITGSQSINWSGEADVIVVGFGASGGCAALEAEANGAQVMIIDRFAGGGASAYSGGIVYAGATRFQREAGYEDTVDNMYAYLIQERPPVKPETLRRYCEESAGNLEWLIEHGVRYSGAATDEKVGYPPEDKFLYCSGNEQVKSFLATTYAVPRGHRTVGKGFTGYALYAGLRKSVMSKPIEFRPHTRATRLIVSPEGRVLGIEAAALAKSAHQRHKQIFDGMRPVTPFGFRKAERLAEEARRLEAEESHSVRLRARAGVILATGGFIYNLPMVGKFRPKVERNGASIMRMGSLGCAGMGHQLGMSVGGQTAFMDHVTMGRQVTPPLNQLYGIAVNRASKRFVTEDAYTCIVGGAIEEQDEAEAWLIVDSTIFWATFRECLGWHPGQFSYLYFPALLNILFGGTRRASTLAKLATKLSFPPEQLERTVKRYNDDIAAGRDDEFGKVDKNCRPIVKAPFYAINLSLGNKYSFTQMFTLGGLKVDEETGLVTNAEGRAIGGLYAVGRTAVGLCSNGYVSGLSLSDCVFSGRRAGRAVARAIAKKAEAAASPAGTMS